LRVVALRILLSLPFGALYEFAIFPRLDGFASLSLALAPMMLLFGFMQATQKLGGVGVVLATAFSGSLALQAAYQPDFASFVNTNSAELVGVLLALVTSLIFRTIDPAWNGARISRAAWRSIDRLATGTGVDAKRWTREMFDRLGLINARSSEANPVATGEQPFAGLADLRIGLDVGELRHTA